MVPLATVRSVPPRARPIPLELILVYGNAKRATTAGVRGYYKPLTPGFGLQAGRDVRRKSRSRRGLSGCGAFTASAGETAALTAAARPADWRSSDSHRHLVQPMGMP